MKKAWDVNVNGVVHTVEYRAGFGTKVIVNGKVYKAKTQNWFINMIDYPITIDGAEIRVVAIGNKVGSGCEREISGKRRGVCTSSQDACYSKCVYRN